MTVTTREHFLKMRSTCLLLFVTCLMHLSDGRVRLDVPGYATVVGGQANSFYEGRPYYFFHNLKYAKAPVGERRFLVNGLF